MIISHETTPVIAVIIPCYKVKSFVLNVIERIGPEVTHIFIVDDACPEKSGAFVEENVRDPRVMVLFHTQNQGVGGATVTGLKAAYEKGADIMVKVDGDGQIDPTLIPTLVYPITQQLADYTKGNRFFSHEALADMPKIRLLGNSVLSFINKAVSGYWNVMDPTNGFFAIHASALSILPLDKLSRDYFFESDMLFRLSTIRAVVWDVPMTAVYKDEKSNLRIGRVIKEFPQRYIQRLVKRIWYGYFLRDFNACSLQFILGSLALLGGTVFGSATWYTSGVEGVFASPGTVILAALPIILGVQLLIAALAFDVANVPSRPLLKQMLLKKKL